jgi:hypothetical protein
MNNLMRHRTVEIGQQEIPDHALVQHDRNKKSRDGIQIYSTF